MNKATNNYHADSIFPSRLRSLMDEKKVTQAELAKICGVQRQSVAQWREGNTRPEILSLGKIAEFFGVSSDYLIGLTDNKTTDKATQDLCSTLGLSEKAINALKGEFEYCEVQSASFNMSNLTFEEIEKATKELVEDTKRNDLSDMRNIINILIEEHVEDLAGKRSDRSLLSQLIDFEHYLSNNLSDFEKEILQVMLDRGMINDQLVLTRRCRITATIQEITAYLVDKSKEAQKDETT